MQCYKCGAQNVKLILLSIQPSGYHQYTCTACNTERLRKYRLTEAGRNAQRRANKKYALTHPERVKAWFKAQVIPEKPCVKCGKLPAHRHHPNPSKPLEVTFLCPLHHKEAHLYL